MTTTLRISLIILSFLFSVPLLHAQNSCQVNLIELDGTYEGDCRGGLAHGEGKAIGQDTYQGEWKKGFPHGVGVYKYANGDVYEGSFERGRREGQGTLTFSDGESREGIWQNDLFSGYYSEAYRFIERPLSGNYDIRRVGSEDNRLEIVLTYKGTTLNPQDLVVTATSGAEVRYTNRFGWENMDFPCTITVGYSVQVGISLQPIHYQFEIMEPGDWKMTMRH